MRTYIHNFSEYLKECGMPMGANHMEDTCEECGRPTDLCSCQDTNGEHLEISEEPKIVIIKIEGEEDTTQPIMLKMKKADIEKLIASGMASNSDTNQPEEDCGCGS